MTLQQDARSIYSPVLLSGGILTAANPGAPVQPPAGSQPSEGVDISGFSTMAVSYTIDQDVTDYSFRLYLWNGSRWKLIEENATLTEDFDQHYHVAAYSRAFLEVYGMSVGASPELHQQINGSV